MLHISPSPSSANRPAADFKCIVTLHDLSSASTSSYGLDVNIFRKDIEKMPKFDSGDVVIVRNAKVVIQSPVSTPAHGALLAHADGRSNATK